jgi:hypothetical protein
MSRAFRSLVALAAATAFAAGAEPSLSAGQEPAASEVKVTVKYNGKGTVDDKHRLWIWLFDNPEIGPGAITVAEMSLEANGETATFSSVAAKQVWVAVAYDEGGGFMGAAPPPPGSPVALYGSTGPDTPPQPVTPGAKGAVSITFDDTLRMQ